MLNILLLDDEEYRYVYLDEFRDKFKKLLKTTEDLNIVWVKTYNEFVETFGSEQWDLVMLDHDIGDFHLVDGKMVELDGCTVARWLAKQHLVVIGQANFIVHSLNVIRAAEVGNILTDAGLNVQVIPFDQICSRMRYS